MALTKCNECGKKVSDRAISCPNCGNPLNKKPSCTVDDLKENRKTSYGNIRLGFGITNLSIGLLIFIAVLSSTGGIEGNILQMSGAWFMFITGLITICGRNKKSLIITSIIFYSFTIMFLFIISSTVKAFSLLTIMNIVFLILTSISFFKDKF